MPRPKDFDIQTIIDHLQGTTETLNDCFGVDGILNEDFSPMYPDMTEDDLTEGDLIQIENQIFLCTGCGWWCDNSEETEVGEKICDDCSEDNFE